MTSRPTLWQPGGQRSPVHAEHMEPTMSNGMAASLRNE